MKKLLLLMLVLMGGVMQMSAGTETTVYYAVPSDVVGTYTVKLNVQCQTGNDKSWQTIVMTKIDKKYDGKDMYTCTYTDWYDGAATMQFQLYNGDQHKGQQQPISSWAGVSTYNGKIYVHDIGWKDYRTDNTVYFKPDDNWKQYNAWFAIYLDNGKNTSSEWKKFTAVEGHDGYYKAAVSAKYTKFILVRMKSSDTETLSWDNKDNQCPTGDNRIDLQATKDTYYENQITGSNWDTDSYGNSLIPWEYYFMSGTNDSWYAVEAMTNTSGTYTYSFSGATYAGKRVSWAPGTSFWAGSNLKSWDDVSKSKTTANDDQYVYFESFNYDDVVLGNTGSAWYVPASNQDGYNDGTITITFNSSDESATIASAKSATIGAAGYITYSNGEKCTISGATAYKVSANNTSTVTLKDMPAATIWPANEGMILKGSENDVVTINSVASGATATTIGTNYLVGTGNSAQNITATDYTYVFANDETHGIGFYKASGDGSLGAHKAYLDLSRSSFNARDFLGFSFGGETTGIANVDINANFDAEAPMYNLAGQRVGKNYKGVVIQNGKKMLMK
jgi:hypothetical protein